jgi:hypothetical protein
LRKEDFEQSFFFFQASRIRGKNIGIEVGQLVQLGERIETHGKNQGDERDLSEKYSPKNRQSHESLLSGNVYSVTETL